MTVKISTLNIVNVVAYTQLNTQLNLEHVVEKLKGKAYFPRGKFPGAVIRLKGWSPATLIFKTGKLITTGGRSVKQAKQAVRNTVKALKKVNRNLEIESLKIANIVATGRLNQPLSLETVYRFLPRAIYEPEQFPGIIFTVKKVRALLFNTGGFVLTGLKTEEEAEQCAAELVETINQALNRSR